MLKFKRLILLVSICICIFANVVNAAALKSNDTSNEPPQRIESNDWKDAGILINYEEKPEVSIGVFVSSTVYAKPSRSSLILGKMNINDTAKVLDAKIYMYPYRGKTVLTKELPKEVTDRTDIPIPHIGDTVYVIFAEKSLTPNANGEFDYILSDRSMIWYKGNLIKIPNETSMYWAYINAQKIRDKETYFELYIKYPDSDGSPRMKQWIEEQGRFYTRNEDTWIHIDWQDKDIQGWILLN